MEAEKIIIRGARQHNLKNIDVDLPRNKLVVITGLSGSGKSSLAFDTLYAEGQRRYVESLSTYARQFLGQMEKPDVDIIEGLSPAIAIEQKSAGHNPRSTVGTVTEIYDYLRLLFARIGVAHCYKCGKPVFKKTLDQVIDQVMALPEGTRIMILSPLAFQQKGDFEKQFKQLAKEGFARVKINGEVTELEGIKHLPKTKKHTIEVVVDRLIVKDTIRNRLADSLELALGQSEGSVIIDVFDGDPILFNESTTCTACGINFGEFTPASFSFNSPHGACPKCDGLGSKTELDPGLIIPDPNLSLRDEAILPWQNRSSVQFAEFLDALTTFYGADIYTPFKDLPETLKKVLLYGSGDTEIPFYFEKNNRKVIYKKTFDGIIPNLKRRFEETQSKTAREEIRQFMNFKPCPECNGTRLNRESRSVKVQSHTISDITRLSVDMVRDVIIRLNLQGKDQIIAKRILKEIDDRLGFLSNVGLGYLTLDRSASTLSGGESQRIRLATQIGSKLTGVMYVLDEPSIGLHQRDNRRLLETLIKMRDLGNTVVIVEHDQETMMSADYIIDMGPSAGIKGGEVVFSGRPEDLLNHETSLTGQYLSGRRKIKIPEKRRSANGHQLVIEGASGNNLKEIDVSFPLGCFTCVTGVSGSGKSTLVLSTLYRILTQRLHFARAIATPYKQVKGIEHADKVINIDQSPIGRTPRSNPGTYAGLFTTIRDLFARTPEARARGYKSGRFSFNMKGGRCEACQGDGIIKIEMHFLPDVYVTCDVCRGKRYNRETLEIKYKGKNISEVLDMTVNQALTFFDKISLIRCKLETLVDVGIGYIHLGQPATTLSGGEAQRIKLSRELSKKGTGKTVYILDEPTTGLHMEDINKLLNVLNRLVDAGNTVIVIEHNLDVIKCADYIIDLGPEGGDDGGFVIGAGTPEALSRNDRSHTGQFLKKVL
ncbi:MAG: excinuclease ABC subunit UvrA [Proteobacteria bacterium]|nr:excinuclease ABC subunit UvrA [Pseudomonadota bacterium]